MAEPEVLKEKSKCKSEDICSTARKVLLLQCHHLNSESQCQISVCDVGCVGAIPL